mgnify:CR=1 FL=1|tara:strand:- start:5873 stop:6421 length:549 start_codon:yes stop_codon:yes gene_type:complete
METSETAESIAVKRWVESVVVQLNLCPFAKRELAENRVRFTTTPATEEHTLLEAVACELRLLENQASIETTLLIHPHVLQDFAGYNQFLDHAEELLRQMQLEGTYQIAGFHPHYQFAGTAASDAENYTNRAPYPLLHLLREDSLEAAIENHPDTTAIPTRNIALMNQLGEKKLQSLISACYG